LCYPSDAMKALGIAFVWAVARAIQFWERLKIAVGLADKPRPTE